MPKSPEELVQTNLRYFGEKRLLAMEDDDLQVLARLMRTRSDGPALEIVESATSTKPTRREIVAYILERKRALATLTKPKSPLSPAKANKAKSTPLSPDDAATVLQARFRKGVAPVAAADKLLKPLLKKRHKMRVVAFNSLKLRLYAEELMEQWGMLMQTFSQFDVILVSEVPAEPNVKHLDQTRAFGMKHLLDMYSHDAAGRGEDEAIEDLWQMAISKPSGPGNLEIHTAFVKRPVELLRFSTNFEAMGVTLDHAPLCCVVKDGRFESADDQTWALSSVHFPPKARHRQRDAQLKAFLGAYSTSSDFRGKTPFNPKGAKDARVACVHHVIAGDFNCYPAEDEFQLKKHGFAPPLLGESISTSAGSQAYDNFLVCEDTEKSFALNRTVLELETHHDPSSGTKGLSDHSPILLSIQEVKKTK